MSQPTHLQWIPGLVTNIKRPGDEARKRYASMCAVDFADMSMSFPEDLNATFHSGLLDTTFNVTSAGPAQDTAGDQVVIPDHNDTSEDYREQNPAQDTAGDQVVIPDHNDISEDYREQNPAQDSAGDQVVVPPDHNDTSEDYREQNQSLYYTHSDLLNKNEVVGEHQGSQSRQCPVLEAPTHHSDLLNKSQSRQCPVLEAPTQHSDLLNKSQSRHCPVLEAPTQRDLPILFYSRTKPPTKRNIKVPKFSKRSRRK